MNTKTTDSAALCRKEQGGRVLSYLNQGYARFPSKAFWRGVALALRRPVNADGRGTFREELIFKLGFGDRYFASHELGQVLAFSQARAKISGLTVIRSVALRSDSV